MHLNEKNTNKKGKCNFFLPQVYYNCSCIEDTHNTSESKAYSGKCATMCNKLPILMVLMLIAGIITCMTSTPVITAVLWYEMVTFF